MKEDTIQVGTRTGKTVELYYEDEAFKKFYPIKNGTRVSTGNGLGTAIGVDKSGVVWFQLDCDFDQKKGVSFWEGLNSSADFKARGIKIINQPIIKQPIIKAREKKTAESLKQIVNNYIKKNAAPIIKALPEVGQKKFPLTGFFKTAYMLLDKNDHPALVKKIKKKLKNENLYASILTLWGKREKKYIAAIKQLEQRIVELEYKK